MSKVKFFVCEDCGSLVEVTDRTENADAACNCQNMKELKVGVVEAAVEKHIPVAEVEGNLVTVKVGSVAHPMLDAHHIAWVYLETDRGGCRKDLVPGTDPVVTFALTDEKPVAVYAYCNLHGLWKAEL